MTKPRHQHDFSNESLDDETDNLLTSDDTPDEIVAQQIINQFVAEDLLPQALTDETWIYLTEGTSRPEDWRLLAEKAVAYQHSDRAAAQLDPPQEPNDE